MSVVDWTLTDACRWFRQHDATWECTVDTLPWGTKKTKTFYGDMSIREALESIAAEYGKCVTINEAAKTIAFAACP
jgi:hypothetical protein